MHTPRRLVKSDVNKIAQRCASMLAMTKRKKFAVDESHSVVRAIRWILANRTDDEGHPLNESTLATKAKLARGHITNILNGEQGADITKNTAIKIGRAFDVRWQWILGGTLPIEPFTDEDQSRVVEYDDPYPDRLPTIAMVRRKYAKKPKIAEAIVDMLKAERHHEGDPGLEHWEKRMQKYERMALRNVDELHPVVPDNGAFDVK